MRDGRRRAVLETIDRLFRSGTASGLSDGQLLERFATRHDEAAEAAFAALVERHGPMVAKVCHRSLHDAHDAQDAFQATFLVLMRKANSVRQRESLGAWLYGVARRVSAQARSAAARRRVVEETVAKARPTVAATTTTATELDRALWDEVDRLPATAREAVVLCYLEGLTHEQAAARLGWPVGTVRSRLARARERLRGRLERKGLAPEGRDAVASLIACSSRAGLPTIPHSLTDATARAALTLTARDAATAGLVSEAAATLTQGVLRTMLLAKLKTVAIAFATAGSLVSGAAAYALQSASAGPKLEQGAPSALDDDPAAANRYLLLRSTEVQAKAEAKRAEETAAAKKKLASEAKDIAERIGKLTAEAVELQEKGEFSRAQRTLADINRLTSEWQMLLSRTNVWERAVNPYVSYLFSGSAPVVSGVPMLPSREVAPLSRARSLATPVVPPVPPVPPTPPPTPATPAQPATPFAGARAKADTWSRSARETENRLDELERKLNRVLEALEKKTEERPRTAR